MFFLIKNISRYGLNLRWTHSSAEVSRLPDKATLADSLMNPFGRSTLQIAHNVVQAMCRSQADQDMGVIFNSADRDRYAAKILNDAANVSVKIVAPVFED